MKQQEQEAEKNTRQSDQTDNLKPTSIPKRRWPLFFAVLVILGIVLLSLSFTVFRPSSARSSSVTATSSGGSAFNKDANNMDGNALKKTSWPECVGMKAEQAQLLILEETHNALHVEVIQRDSMVTADYRTDRVRVYVSDDGIVVREPRIG